MVCQAASQTRFRALKHESGIAGRPTIIVRVIACFQPLQDCQVLFSFPFLIPESLWIYYKYKSIYFLVTLFGWMVKAEDSWLFQQHSARCLPNLNCTPLQQGQQNVLPSSINRWPAQTNGANGLSQFLLPRLDSLPYAFNPYVKEEPSAFYHGHGVKATTNGLSGSTHKRFVIFDQSGNHTRLFFSPLCSPAQNPIVAPTKWLGACDLHDEGKTAKIDQIFPTKPTIQEKSEDEIIGEGGSEMHEDTEEINALLYSDDDGDDSEEDDEVTSTDRSPFVSNGSYKKREHMEEITAENANSESPTKRQRLIDGGFKKPSLMDIVSSVKMDDFYVHDGDAESSCAKGRNQGEDLNSILSTQHSRKDKIRETLKILESIIPGVKSKDPLLVIEEAISYLKCLKLKAKALGVS